VSNELVGLGERYAAQPSPEEAQGWAYAVERVGSERAVRYHDAEPLGGVLARWRQARAAPGGELAFSGVPDDDSEAAASYAGALLASEVVGVRYWSPQDDRAHEAAYEAVGLLLSAINQGIASVAAGAIGAGGLKL
jgi:hypothetical protein